MSVLCHHQCNGEGSKPKWLPSGQLAWLPSPCSKSSTPAHEKNQLTQRLTQPSLDADMTAKFAHQTHLMEQVKRVRLASHTCACKCDASKINKIGTLALMVCEQLIPHLGFHEPSLSKQNCLELRSHWHTGFVKSWPKTGMKSESKNNIEGPL